MYAVIKMNIIEWIRVILLGVIEGITEWLPISSTGHMILFQDIWPTGATTVMTEEFMNMFDVVIQLGAILAVVTIFFHKLNPISSKKSKEERKQTIDLWKKVIVGCIPAGVFGVLFDDYMDTFSNWQVISAMLILYGIAFIVLEERHKGKKFAINTFSELTYKTAFLIGVIQILSLVPGTSRSGVTIVGAMLIGCSRYIAAEYTFYLAIPIMFGASGLRLLKFLIGAGGFTGSQFAILLVGMVVAYIVSVFVIKFLMGYIKKHDFKVFGYYRIVLGVLVVLYFAFIR